MNLQERFPGRVAVKVTEAAEVLGITRDLVRTWIRVGKLRAVKPGGSGNWLVYLDDLAKVMEEGSNHG